MPFFIASADSSGAIIATSSEMLSPGPSAVDYPMQPAGRIVDTAGGTRIKQLPPKDPRPRAWEWEMLPTYRPAFVRLMQRLEGLLGTTRQQRGLSPWIYLKDTETNQFCILQQNAGIVTAATTTTLTDSAQAWMTNVLTNGVVEIISGTAAGQRRSILSNTSTQATVDTTWDVTPAVGDRFNIQYQDATWIRVRVLNVTKRPMAKRDLTYEGVRLEFVVDDTNWNTLG